MSDVQDTITAIFAEKPIFEGIEGNEDFFDRGASSLTVVDLQIQIEKALGKEVDTSKLMANPTIDGWIAAYSA